MIFTPSEVRSYYAARLPHLKITSNREWRSPCPIHQGTRDSFAINAETGLAQCHSQCGRGWDMISFEQEISGLDFPRAKDRVFELVGRPKVPWEERNVEAIYDYTDADGAVLYQVLRYHGKEFKQRRPDGSSGHVWGLGGCAPVPYRLQKLRNAEFVAVCYSSDTEVLSRRGWIKFPELQRLDEVAQFFTDGHISFTHPIAIQRFTYVGEMLNFRADWCDMMVTPDHRILVRAKKSSTCKGKRHKGWCSPSVRVALAATGGLYYPVAGVAEGSGDHPTEVEARAIAAWCADGVNEQRGFKVSWNLKKGRKKDRIQELLRDLGVPFTAHVYDSTPEWTNYRVVRDSLPWIEKWCPDKQVPFSAIDWPQEIRTAFLSELGYWDGDHCGVECSRFFTARCSEADTISAMAALSGWGCVLREDNRENRPEQKTQYIVNLVSRDWRQATRAPEYIAYEGEVHCCTVPSGFIVTRRNGKTTISGNCEGEKDCLTMERLGVCATCNNGGAGNFRPELAPHFNGKHVAVFPDNDDKGREHALKVAALLAPVAKSLKVVELPDLPLKGDVTDFVLAGGTLAAIRELYRKAQPWTPEWQFGANLPSENDAWVRSISQEVEAAGGVTEFWNLARLVGLQTPWKKLSHALGGGMRTGEVYVLGANQGAGKTSMALQFTISAMRRKEGVLYFSMEMSWRSIFHRMASIEARVDLNELRRAQIELKVYGDMNGASRLNGELMTALARQTSELSEFPLLVCTRPSITPDYIIEETKRLKRREKINLVVVDHMQLMASSGDTRGDYEKFTAISRAMKQVSVEINVPVLLVSQTNRIQAKEHRGEVEASDLRGSGAIEEDAAAVLLLYESAEDRTAAKSEGDGSRYTKGPVKCVLKIGKNRYGEQGRCFELQHYKSCTRFDMASESEA